MFGGSNLAKRKLSHDVIASDLPPDFSRHARRCAVCAHPDRDAIEGDFIRWTSGPGFGSIATKTKSAQ
jgi:hypothetical protein